MPRISRPSFASRTRPTKLASAPTSTRPRVSASSSRPTSKSSAWTRTNGTSASGDRREEGDLVAGLQGRGGIGHALVHGDAPGLARSEGRRPAIVALPQLLHEGRHGGRSRRERHLLAGASDALAQAREIEERHHHAKSLADESRPREPQVLEDEAG